MPTVQEVINDPDFISLPPRERHKVLVEIDEDFRSLPQGEQMKVASSFGRPQQEPPKPQGPQKDYSFTGQVKRAVTDPLGYAGDVFSLENAKNIVDYYTAPTAPAQGLGDFTTRVLPESAAKLVPRVLKGTYDIGPKVIAPGIVQPIMEGDFGTAGYNALNAVAGVPSAAIGAQDLFGNKGAFKEVWSTDPVGAGLASLPFTYAAGKGVKGTVNATGKVVQKGIPGTEKYYKVKAGEQLQQAINNEAGLSPETIAARRSNTTTIPKPEAARLAEAKRAAETADLKARFKIKPTLAQELGDVQAAAFEQSMAAKNPDLMQALKYKDAEINQVGLQNLKKAVGEGRELPLPGEGQAIGRDLVSTIEGKRLPAKTKVAATYRDVPDTPIKIEPLKDAVSNLKNTNLPMKQKAKINSVLKYIENEIAEPKQAAGPQILGADGKPIASAKPAQSVGFQKLHSVQKTLGNIINDSLKGMEPDRTTAKFLGELKDTIDAVIEQDMGTATAYNNAKRGYQAYANQFNTGEVAKVLQRGKEATGLRIPDERIPQHFFTPSGADSLIRAVGTTEAKSAISQHAVADLIKKTTSASGDMNIARSMAWLRQNKAVLDKYGLTKEMEGLVKDQVPNALNGIIEGKRLDVLDNPYLTVSEARKLVRDFKPAMKQLYKDNPEALRALDDYHKLIQLSSRNKNVTYSGGSTTVEKASMSNFFTDAAKRGVSGWASRMTRGLSDVIAGYGEKQINALMKDAVLNPETAKALMDLADNANNKSASAALSKRLSELGAGALGKIKQERGSAPVAPGYITKGLQRGKEIAGEYADALKGEITDIRDEFKDTFTKREPTGRNVPVTEKPFERLRNLETLIESKANQQASPTMLKNLRDALLQEVREIREEFQSMYKKAN